MWRIWAPEAIENQSLEPLSTALRNMNPNIYTFYRMYRNEKMVYFFCFYITVVIATATGWTVEVRFPAEARNFSLLHSVQTGPGAHPTSYPTDT
jgi:hypothetical protein